jgi:hypothetical protein
MSVLFGLIRFRGGRFEGEWCSCRSPLSSLMSPMTPQIRLSAAPSSREADLRKQGPDPDPTFSSHAPCFSPHFLENVRSDLLPVPLPPLSLFISYISFLILYIPLSWRPPKPRLLLPFQSARKFLPQMHPTKPAAEHPRAQCVKHHSHPSAPP